jgi:medium-chain acyl-[acyl-carrier-protein] hydrolase
VTAGWLGRPAGPDDAAVRLFCFAHAGGGGAFFRPWREALRPEVAVRPVILPGREARVREEPYRRLSGLLDPVCEALAPLLDRPFALFGHSMGSVVAYEVARRLAASATRGPGLLLVSGRRAPHLPARRRPLHGLPDREFVAALGKLGGTPPQVLGQPDLLSMFLPCLRADFELNETYTPLPGGTLACPVSALTGDVDPEVDVDEMAAWRAVTVGGFTLRVFRGDHFYHQGRPGEVLAALRADLRRLRTPVAG